MLFTTGFLRSLFETKSFKQYDRFVTKNAKRKSKIQKGKFYTFVYDYKLDYNFNELKFFDSYPLTFIYSITYSTQTYFTGINFHHLPIKIRKKILDGLLSKNLKTISYNDLKVIEKTSPFAVRKYLVDSVVKLYEVDETNIDEFIQIATKTYEQSTFEARMRNYEKNK